MSILYPNVQQFEPRPPVLTAIEFHISTLEEVIRFAKPLTYEVFIDPADTTQIRAVLSWQGGSRDRAVVDLARGDSLVKDGDGEFISMRTEDLYNRWRPVTDA